MHAAPASAPPALVRAASMPTARDFWSVAPTVLALHVLVLWGSQIFLAPHTAPAPRHLVDVRLLPPHQDQADDGTHFAIAPSGTPHRQPHRRSEAAQGKRHADAPQDTPRIPPPRPVGLAGQPPEPRPADPGPSTQNSSATPLDVASAAIPPDSSDQARQTPPEASFRALNGASAAQPRRPTHPSTAMAAMTPPSLGASYLHNPKPVYPALARRLGEEGTVVLQVRVSANGLVDSVSIRRTSGYPELDRAALSAVRQWTFTPASRAGRPVAGWVLVPILFSLDESAG